MACVLLVGDEIWRWLRRSIRGLFDAGDIVAIVLSQNIDCV